jgi:hypothetical protein
MGRFPKEGDVIQPVGHFTGVEYAKRQMQIDWMYRDELSQAIPPIYTKYIYSMAISKRHIYGRKRYQQNTVYNI